MSNPDQVQATPADAGASRRRSDDASLREEITQSFATAGSAGKIELRQERDGHLSAWFRGHRLPFSYIGLGSSGERGGVVEFRMPLTAVQIGALPPVPPLSARWTGPQEAPWAERTEFVDAQGRAVDAPQVGEAFWFGSPVIGDDEGSVEGKGK